jgi:RNA polymerase sigma-70 factor (ECF subfamily)
MKPPDGRRALYESWVRDYSADIYRCAFRLCGDADCAEELAQEVFFEAWRSIESLRDPDKAKGWLLSILRHRYMHWLRDRKRERDIRRGERINPERLAGHDHPPHEVLARKEALQTALNALEDHYKVPFLLVFLEGMTCQETADFLDVPLGTVLSRIYRARRVLRQHLQEDSSGDGRLRLHREEPEQQEPPMGMGDAS